jgi:septal ring factor EnvC (AmiA/AmiB activator)
MQRCPDIRSRFDTARRGQLRALRIPLSVALLSGVFAGMSLPVRGQVATATPTPPAAATSPDDIKQREQELEATRAQQKSAAEEQEKLKADIAAIGQDRAKFNQQLIDIAAQVRGVETKIGDAEARLHPLDDREQQIRGSLDSRRSEIIEV